MYYLDLLICQDQDVDSLANGVLTYIATWQTWLVVL
jgi:hypothetical protein